jgi:hypothetical protein
LSTIEAALPDYAPSFSALEHQTAQIKAQLDKIAASPSVQLSAEQHAVRSTRAIAEKLEPTLKALQDAIAKSDQLQGELVQLTRRIHIRSNHWPLPILAPFMGLVLGFMLFPLLARTLPNGASLTAITTGYRDVSQAGWRLIYDANPVRSNEINWSLKALDANREAFGKCSEAVVKSKKPQPCTITLHLPFPE